MTSKPSTSRTFGYISTLDTLKTAVTSISPDEWNIFTRKDFHGQKDVSTVMVLNLPDKSVPRFQSFFINQKIYKKIQICLGEIDQLVMGYYRNNLDIKRCMLTLLPPKKSIDLHKDVGYHLTLCHRIHVPVFTSDNVNFMVEGQKVVMSEGEVVEINNNAFHEVINRSSKNRIHLVLDYGMKEDPYYLF